MRLNTHVRRVFAVTALLAMATGTGLVVPASAADDVGLVHTKTVIPEGDGYRISLTANSQRWSTLKPVDVVLLLDHSGSMFAYLNSDTEQYPPLGVETTPDNPSRWDILSKDLREFGDDLFNGVNRSSVITFDKQPTVHTFSNGSLWTADKEDWLDATLSGFDRQNVIGGTNWTDSLNLAKNAVRRMDRSHGHIFMFVTDGHFTMYTNDQGDIGNCPGLSAAPSNTELEGNLCYKLSLKYAQELYGLQDDLRFISIGVGNNVPVLGSLHKSVTGSEEDYHLGSDEINLNAVFNEVTMSAISPLSIKDTLSENVNYDDDLRVSDGSGKAVPANQYVASYDDDSRSVKVVFNTAFTPVDGQTYTVSFKVKPSRSAYETLAAADGDYPDTGEPGTGEISAGKPGLFSNDFATVTYNDRGTPVTLDYPRPVIQVTLPSWSVRRTGDCATATVTTHLFMDGEDTGLSADLATNASYTFSNLLPGHTYELRADSAGEACAQPTVEPGVFEPQPGNETLTSTLETDRIPAVVHYDPNGGEGQMPDVNGYVGDTPEAGESEFTSDDECIEFAGWNTSADGSGTGYQPGERLDPLATEVTLYAQWRHTDGCPTALSEQGGLPHTGVAVTALILGIGGVVLLGVGALTLRRSRGC